MFNKDNFIEATFIDTERKNIEVLTKSDDGIITPTIIPFNEENQIFKELMKGIWTNSNPSCRRK